MPIKTHYMGFRYNPGRPLRDSAPGRRSTGHVDLNNPLAMVRADNIYFKTTNWSHQLRNCLVPNEDSGYRNDWFGNAQGARSGQGLFKFYPGILIDAEEDIILAIRVNAGSNHAILMINSSFDTPRCPIKWSPMRKHVRKMIYTAINERSTKVVKVSTEFLQGFKATYNFVPTIVQMEQIKRSVVHNGLDALGGNSRQRRRDSF